MAPRTTYTDPVNQGLPFQNLPSQATPVNAEWFTGVHAMLGELAGPGGRVQALEADGDLTLPHLVINTENGVAITSKDVYVNATISIDGTDPTPARTTRIRGRGNTTWTLDKKPYRLNLDVAASLVQGLPSSKNWVLLANAYDYSKLRAEVAWSVAGRLAGTVAGGGGGLGFVNRFRLVEVILNGASVGIYQLGQHQEIDPTKVAIDKAGTAGQALTGGYLAAFDTNDPESFRTQATTFHPAGARVAMDDPSQPANEIQTVTVNGSPTGGTFTLTLAGQTTSALAYNASAAAVQAALAALSNVGTGNVFVSAPANGGPYAVEFVNALSATDLATMTATSSLTGGTTPTVTVAATQAPGSPVQRDYFRGALNAAEAVLYGGASWTNSTTGWRRYFDIDSWACWWLVEEMIANVDAHLEKSCKWFKARDAADGTPGKVFAGPVWDFDNSMGQGFGNGTTRSATGWYTRPSAELSWAQGGARWLDRMWLDPAFKTAVVAKWTVLRASLLGAGPNNIHSTIDRLVDRIHRAAKRDQGYWTASFAGYSGTDVDAAAAAMKTWVKDRIAFLDAALADVTAPSAPTSLTATPDNTSIALSWTGTTDSTGSKLRGYVVRVGGVIHSLVDAGTTTKTITGLTNGTSYTCTVTSVDYVGNESSAASASATPNVSGPSAISGLRAWYKASAVTGLADGDPVSSVNDSSGNSRNLTSGSTDRPTFKTGLSNGKPGFRFDGSNDVLATAAGSGAQLFPDTAWTAFAVIKPGGSGQQTIFGPESGSGAPQLAINSSKQVQIVKANTAVVATSATALSTSVFTVVVATFDPGVGYAIYLHSTTADVSGATAVTMTAQGTIAGQIGRRSTSEPLNADLLDAGVFGGVLSSTDRATLINALKSEYGL